jgi:hypothetical protein
MSDLQANTSRDAVKKEMTLKTKPGLIEWCRQYGLEVDKGQSRKEIEGILLEHADILMAAQDQAEPLTKDDLNELKPSLKEKTLQAIRKKLAEQDPDFRV